MATIDALEKRVGRDGITRLARANVQRLAGDLPAALASTEASIALEPDRLDAYDQRATLLVESGRHRDAVAAYQDLESRFGIELQRSSFTDPTFAAFVNSPEFRAWLPE